MDSMKELPSDVLTQVEALKRKSRLYGKMADELRAMAAKLEYDTLHPGKFVCTACSEN